MATLSEVRTRVNQWLTDKWPAVVSKQDVYFAAHGEYWQGLITHTTIPTFTDLVDGDAIPDRLLSKPTNMVVSWADAFPSLVGITWPAALLMNVYDGPAGKGWQATLFIYYDSVLYTRSGGVGPESDSRDFNWQVWTPPIE